MPCPLSHTCMRNCAPRRRQPITIPPLTVLATALDTKFSRIRSSRMGSLRTQALFDTIRNESPFLRAVAAKVLSVRLSRCAIGKSVTAGVSAKASSLEMSSRLLNNSSMAVTAASIARGFRAVRRPPRARAIGRRTNPRHVMAAASRGSPRQ